MSAKTGKGRAKARRKRTSSTRVEYAPASAAHGSLDGVQSGTRPIVRLPDGEIGYCMAPGRPDECLRAAIATVAQVAVEQVPDPRLDARLALGEQPEDASRASWTRLLAWLDGRGLRLGFHETPPVDRRRWIGVWVMGSAELDALKARLQQSGNAVRDVPFADHCLVMAYDQIIFDPAVSLPAPTGTKLREWRPSDVTYGITLDQKE